MKHTDYCKGTKYWDCKGDYRGLFQPKFINLGKDYCEQCGKLKYWIKDEVVSEFNGEVG